ncbi:alpha-dehydro-beta-deoxy-D-glucarate aldolase [Yersinia aldovae ATCC 35236]|uniref:Alpha-dehydro-beta-deoxy-D-glucarate aldolase n=1 Tax=Yersinia aldovae TaxID=29483 RepID=A0A0T9UQP7_YERAL|nr:alpha-dehydro-beta-deoxy-D-glucarate aldolase [Yersinia aldovae ATCC 35236]CNL61451.1 alpha-dehydro-beta-deoxy-D-glucarate aldolase [Yersinia aldovae]CNL75740.1 alpha-dehydro-beta-deoxy-D-glucarate aldolase [Yersinia aldovae]
MSMQNYPNQFRRNLQQGQTLIGCWSALANNISGSQIIRKCKSDSPYFYRAKA